MKKDQFGNILCPNCEQRKYKIENVSVAGKGLIKFKALCLICKKKFKYIKPVQEVGSHYGEKKTNKN